MVGFIIGTVCLIGLVKMARRGCGYGYGGGCHGGACGGGGGGGGCGHGGGGGCGYGRWGGGGCGSGRWGGHHGGRWGWHGHHHGHGEGYGAEGAEGGGYGPGHGMRRWAVSYLSRELDATPAQEKVIGAAFDEAFTAIRTARGEWSKVREDVAKAMAGESFDETAMGGAFARQDETIAQVRRAVTGALAKVHDALDARQRARLAEIMAQGPRGFGAFGRFGGPYRV
jgi:hypothetical protein